MSVQLRIGDGHLHIADEFPEMGVLAPPSIGGTPVVLALDVADADAVFAQAVDAGAEVRQPLQDMFWGDRHGQLADPFGHRWNIVQHLRYLPHDEIVAAAAQASAASYLRGRECFERAQRRKNSRPEALVHFHGVVFRGRRPGIVWTKNADVARAGACPHSRRSRRGAFSCACEYASLGRSKRPLSRTTDRAGSRRRGTRRIPDSRFSERLIRRRGSGQSSAYSLRGPQRSPRGSGR